METKGRGTDTGKGGNKMKKLELEQLISERQNEAKEKQIVQKADLLAMIFGDTTDWSSGECGNEIIVLASAFQYRGLKIEAHFAYSHSININYGKENVFFATYEQGHGSVRRPGELVKPANGKISAEEISIQIYKYLPGEWEKKIEAYAKNPDRISRGYYRERNRRLKQEYEEKNKPKKVTVPIDPAKAEATEEEIKAACENFGIKPQIKQASAKFRKYSPELRKYMQFLEESSREVSKWPAWRKAGIVPMYEKEE